MSIWIKLLAAVVGGGLLMAYLIYFRGFFTFHATIIGFAGGGLVYWTLRAVENLRQLRR